MHKQPLFHLHRVAPLNKLEVSMAKYFLYIQVIYENSVCQMPFCCLDKLTLISSTSGPMGIILRPVATIVQLACGRLTTTSQLGYLLDIWQMWM